MRMNPLAYAIGLIGFAGIAIAHADDQAAQPVKTERIEVTGTSIKRIAKEGALPVTSLSQEDIKKSGATSATDLIQMLPNMQGFTTASQSVNGGGAGQASASLHALNQKYTLVLLNGRRMAPWNNDGSVNLESIPLDAIERVEVLSDGASALYGSDAVAGVVNFILKKNKTDGNVSFTYDRPERAGGSSWAGSFSKGFGDINTDNYNVLVAISADHQSPLNATQRGASAQGAYIPFTLNGQSLVYSNSNASTQPANLTVGGYLFNPYYAANGNCGTPFAFGLPGRTAPNGQQLTTCEFNYAKTVEDVAQADRHSGYVSGRLRINDDLTLFTELMASDYRTSPRYAPPAQTFKMTAASFPTLWSNYVQPFEKANGLSNPSASFSMRVTDAGDRTDEYITDAQHAVFGLEGSLGGWDVTEYYVHSQNEQWDNMNGGYLDSNMFMQAINAGTYNPFVSNAAQAAVIAPAVLHTNLWTQKNAIDTVNMRGSHDLFDLPAGPSTLAIGADWTKTKSNYATSALAQGADAFQPNFADGIVGRLPGLLPQVTSRTNWGAFTELALPILKNLDVDLSARYDDYSRTHSDDVFGATPMTFLGSGDLGNKFDATTYKATFRFTPVDNVLFRGSYGTGFRAPTMNDIAAPLSGGGVTSGSYACPFNTPATCPTPYVAPGSKGPNGLPVVAQTTNYDILTGGNALSGANGLKPEKTKQWTLGFRVDPIRGLSLGADLWNIKLKDQILSAGIPEQVAFANPQAYANLFVNPYNDPFQGQTIALEETPRNEAEGLYRGIDWDFSYRTKTAIGNLSTSWTGTYMLKAQYQLQPGVWSSDLGKFGDDQQVVFRTQMHLTASLQRGAWTNTAIVNAKSGYHDQAYCGTNIYVPGAGGALSAYPWKVDANGNCLNPVGLDIPVYATMDWQTKYDFSKSFALSGGIKNVFDKTPPQSLQNSGGGNQGGYDARYADIFGRTYYLTGNYRF